MDAAMKLDPRRRAVLVVGGLALVVFLFALFVVWPSRSAPQRSSGMLPCPDSPNCVSSLAQDPRHAIEPLSFASSKATPAQAGEAALRALKRMPRTRITVMATDPFHAVAECTTLVLRFKDDVELRLDPERRLIDIRSASRVGHSDFGANRKRMERLRHLFEEELGRP